MRIDWLRVEGFKNLRDFKIDLAEKREMSVLIGENGSGKSNLFEALVQIFRALDHADRSEFAYEIRYRCRERDITVAADPAKDTGEGYTISVDGKKLVWGAFKRRRAELLPTHVFAYYSGPSKRLGRLFQQHTIDFVKQALAEKVSVGEMRRLFYCLPEHSRFVLLSYFIDSKTDRSFLRNYFGIEGFDSALLVLKTPWWDASKKTQLPGADLRFWGARGDVSRFLDAVWNQSLAPMRTTERVAPETPDERTRNEHRAYLYLQDTVHLQELARSWASPKEFFSALDATQLADLIDDVRVRVRCVGGDAMTFSELSEGEQQLLTVVGMLRFTQGEETLFLLDEPDTHLNPRWKLDYLKLLEKEVGAVAGTSQLILSTHDPLTIAALEKEQVQIFRRSSETRAVEVHEAQESPRGLGVAGVLTEMFGLPRTLDKPTLEMMSERNQLARLGARTEAQEHRLGELNEGLAALGFMHESRDPRVRAVLREISAWEQASNKLFWELSIEEQRALARRLVEKHMGKPSPEVRL